MALQHSARAATRLCRRLRTDCADSRPPACPTCAPQPRPPCRRRAAECPRALRVLCCPPPAGARPPCAPPPSPPPLTCEHASHKLKSQSAALREYSSETAKGVIDCHIQLDRVAQRLKAAEEIRRAEYEREVASRQPEGAPAPAAYSLATDRQCLRASDGRDYNVADPPREPARCGPCRTPPPPCPVKLMSDEHCDIPRSGHVDPCKHLPRVFVEIDRRSPLKPVKNSSQSPEPNISQQPQITTCNKTESLTTRLMGKLKSGSGASCPRKSNEPQCGEGKARYAFDEQWCRSPPTPAPAPPKCQEPSIVERLRRRPSSSSVQHCNPKRHYHTTITLQACENKSCKLKPTETSKSQVDKLDEILKQRSSYKEAGQGRVVGMGCKPKKNKALSAGNLELPVPSSADKVRVQVSLDFDSGNERKGCCPKPISSSPCQSQIKALCSDVKQPDNNSWLSLKNIQKKFSSCRKSDDSFKKKTPHGGSCPRPQKPKPASAVRPPCAPSPQEHLPKRKSDPCQPKLYPSKYQSLPDFLNVIYP